MADDIPEDERFGTTLGRDDAVARLQVLLDAGIRTRDRAAGPSPF